jgi:hypothetical protein
MIIRKNEGSNTFHLDLIFVKYRLPAIFSLIPNRLRQMFVRNERERQVVNIYRLGESIAVLLLVVIGVTIWVRRVRSTQRRRALEQILARYYSGLALVRYVMLNRHCSEEAAYQRLATFVKQQMPLDDQSSIDRMLAYDRQSLLEHACSILVHNPDEIDKI